MALVWFDVGNSFSPSSLSQSHSHSHRSSTWLQILRRPQLLAHPPLHPTPAIVASSAYKGQLQFHAMARDFSLFLFLFYYFSAFFFIIIFFFVQRLFPSVIVGYLILKNIHRLNLELKPSSLTFLFHFRLWIWFKVCDKISPARIWRQMCVWLSRRVGSLILRLIFKFFTDFP